MNIKCDSRKVKKGDIFVAIKYVNDGHEYIEDAIRRGASKIVASEGLYSVETLITKDPHEYLVKYLKENYWDSIKDLKIIGMTGTNGKTTTCFLIHKALNALNKKCAYIGTIGFYIDDKIKDLNNTTPDILDLYEMLIESKEQGCEYVVMEVSSHALSKDRVKGLEFDYTLFSNLTRDHLDYHENIENYKQEKLKLFKMLREENLSIINVDDKYHKDFLIEQNKNITYGFNECNYQITNYKTDILGSEFIINNCDVYKTKLIGKHNIYNLTCVIVLLSKLGVSYEEIYEVVNNLDSPSGRMDSIKYKNNNIIVDYAHTPDAVQNILEAVKALNPNYIYTIIGCGGDRDKTKRPIMGDIATRLSDYVIFTSDNPRSEDPYEIINDIVQKLDKKNYEIEVNREKAIVRGIQKLTENDILMILGKGHETYQIIGNKKIDFNDKKIVIDNI